nr:PREDICTED: protein GLE1 [Musa acuminata subsp. malaccensis]
MWEEIAIILFVIIIITGTAAHRVCPHPLAGAAQRSTIAASTASKMKWEPFKGSGAVPAGSVFSSPGAAQRSIVPVPAASKMKWESSNGSGVAPDRSGYVRLELPCPKSCLVVASADPEPWTTMDDLVSGLKALESRLGYNSPPVPLKQPPEWVSPRQKAMDARDKTRLGGSMVAGWRISCPDFDFSDSEESDDDLTIGRTTCLLDKEDLDKSILFMLEQENQLRVKEELRCKLAKLEVAQRNEMNRFASAISQIDKYVEDRQEMDRRFDQQYRRKIAEVVDSHLSAVRRDHEKRSQIEERRIRDDAALEEAKKKAILEEKLRQEKAKAEAEAKLRAAKLAEEAERVALEAAQRAAAEAAESKAAASEDTKKKSMDHNEEETKERGSGSEVPKEVQLTTGCPTPKVLAVDAALRAEASRQKIYNEVAEKSNLIASKEFDRCGRQIYKNLKQITGTVENVRAKTHALIDLLNNPVCPSSISVFLFAKKVVSLCEDPTGTFDSTAFACGQVILLVSSQVPAVMDFVLAEFHKSCIYTVPKYLQPSDQTLQTRDYWKMVGYHEVDGKIESSENYLNRVQSYMKLYAAIVQTEIEGVRNPHGLAEGWAWLARFLNALPANRSTAYALEAFLKMAGFALHRRYKSQFKKVLNAISRSFLPALRERGDRKLNEIIKRLEQYLEDQVFLKEPEGWRLHSSLLSKELV